MMRVPGAKYLSCEARISASRSRSAMAPNGACGLRACLKPAMTLGAGMGACKIRRVVPATRAIACLGERAPGEAISTGAEYSIAHANRPAERTFGIVVEC